MNRINCCLILLLLFMSNRLFAQSERPNILLLLSDQHGGKVMTQTGYSYIKTPGLDKLADEGVTYTRSYCTYPVCVASRASFLTGKMPSVSHNNNLTSHPSIGTKMQEAGYQTAYFGKWHVSNSKMQKVEDWHGFQQYEDLRKD